MFIVLLIIIGRVWFDRVFFLVMLAFRDRSEYTYSFCDSNDRATLSKCRVSFDEGRVGLGWVGCNRRSCRFDDLATSPNDFDLHN